MNSSIVFAFTALRCSIFNVSMWRGLAVKEGDELLLAVRPGGKATMIRKPRSFAVAMAGLYGHLWKGIDSLIYQKTGKTVSSIGFSLAIKAMIIFVSSNNLPLI